MRCPAPRVRVGAAPGRLQQQQQQPAFFLPFLLPARRPALTAADLPPQAAAVRSHRQRSRNPNSTIWRAAAPQWSSGNRGELHIHGRGWAGGARPELPARGRSLLSSPGGAPLSPPPAPPPPPALGHAGRPPPPSACPLGLGLPPACPVRRTGAAGSCPAEGTPAAPGGLKT